MKTSIIVAVYNTADYLKQCLDSLIRQTDSNIEILCVDDCSTDNSLEILRSYAACDNRIKLFRTEKNSGPAVARNIAIDNATGELTAFVDSDDWLSDDAIEKTATIFQQNKNTGCVLLECMKVLPNGDEQLYPMEAFHIKSGKEAFIDSLTWKIHGIYIAKTELYKKFKYDTTCKTFSDDNTTRLHYYFSKEVRLCDGIYYYRYNPNSISNITDISRINYMLANESMKNTLISLKVENSVISLYEYQRWLVLVDTYMFYYQNRKQFSNSDKQYCLSEMKRIWKGIETFHIPMRKKLKLGYYPFRHCWTLFILQEELYFTLKSIIMKK